jgi:6-pyruvoyltetrahydropterin/6-carboxytetrahydropterin synthase
LKITETSTQYIAHFDDEELVFLKRDVLLLPIENSTLEEFARFMLRELVRDHERLQQAQIDQVIVKVFSGPGQSASAEWSS